jgi:hydroxymethylglutaryl-CoA synthase
MRRMRGIISWGAYLPYRRLDRSTIAAVAGQGGGKGTRTVASFDEDPLTMAVEAGRLALRAVPAAHPRQLLFGTVSPAYADKTNATVVHAALRLDDDGAAFDLGLSPRSALGGVLLGLAGGTQTLVTAADIRTGLPGSAEEANGGDAGAAILVGEDSADAPVVAEVLATASVTAEFVERWRTPGDVRTKTWDDKFSEVTYTPLGQRAWKEALAKAGVEAAAVDLVAVSAPTTRVGSSVAGKLGAVKVVDTHATTVGITGAAQPLFVLAALLEQAVAEGASTIALVSLADGADAIVLRLTPAAASFRAPRPIAAQVTAGAPIAYGKFLAWRGMLKVEPPRRPEPTRISATVAARNQEWKFGFVASRDQQTGMVHMPPSRVSADGERTDQMDPVPMADTLGTIATFTVDRLAYSPSPPIVFAVVDFDGGGRLPIELTDTDADEVAIGKRVEMTFRLLFTADGLPNYFWKGRLVRESQQPSSVSSDKEA